MNMKLINESKKRYLDLLLLADEQEDMIDRYLEFGDMFAIYDVDLVGVCVVVRGNDICELKNIAIYPQHQRKGYGIYMVNYICDYYRDKCKAIIVGTGDIFSAISFYTHCGFKLSHVVKNFFIDNYHIPIIENDNQLVDMIYLRKDL